MLEDRIRRTVREIPNFPEPGINFKDITPILEDHQLSGDIVKAFAAHFGKLQLDCIVGIESRGFLFGMMLAHVLKVPFVAIRKKGKLPYKTVSYKYDLEYGTAEMEMHRDVIKEGWKVLVHDDLLATGGTSAAAAELVKMQAGQVIGFAFVIELSSLNGVEKLKIHSDNIVNLVSY